MNEWVRWCDTHTQKSLDHSFHLTRAKWEISNSGLTLISLCIPYICLYIYCFTLCVCVCVLDIPLTSFWAHSLILGISPLSFFLLLLLLQSSMRHFSTTSTLCAVPLWCLFSCVYNCNLLKYFQSFDGGAKATQKQSHAQKSKSRESLYTR